IRPTNEIDLLWSVEESLRSAPVSLVIAEPMETLSLTAGRRLQLAAEAGQTVGLMLIRAGAGSSAAQTRWCCQPQAGGDSTLHQWSLIRNKTGTIANWRLYWDGRSAACHMVSEAGKRPLPAKTDL